MKPGALPAPKKRGEGPKACSLVPGGLGRGTLIRCRIMLAGPGAGWVAH